MTTKQNAQTFSDISGTNKSIVETSFKEKPIGDIEDKGSDRAGCIHCKQKGIRNLFKIFSLPVG